MATNVLKRRVITAAIGIPIMLALIYWGGWVLAIATAILSTVGIYEMDHMFRSRTLVFFPRIGALWAWAAIFAQAAHWPLLPVLVAGLTATVLAAVVLGREANSFEGAMTTTWASLYVGVLLSFLLLLRTLDHGRRLTFGFFVVIWITDAMAFFMGRKFGRRKLLPHVSPGKTWVGTLSGFFSAMVAGMLLSGWLSLGEWQGALFGAVISVSGQIGDLLESQFKRYAGVKDSGGLLPGHGGFLDRFDSVLLALPLAYYFLRSLGIS